VDTVAERCTEVESGARNVDNILTNTLLPDVSRMLLAQLVEGTKPSSIRISIEEDGSFGYGIDQERRIAFDAPVVRA
jgi:type VI secretion system protein VasG